VRAVLEEAGQIALERLAVAAQIEFETCHFVPPYGCPRRGTRARDRGPAARRPRASVPESRATPCPSRR
jgi:hypothetical protein